MESLVTVTIGLIGIISVIKVFLTKSRALKLPIICCINFCIAALIALYIKSPMGAVAAVVYFALSTVSSNAIAHTLGEIDKMDEFEKKR
ncbi:DUF2109 domain-containing protein [Methanococcus maripaludis]|uniref:Energy-converting hydrogenase A subunit C n=2 Tax=Methanococcus maripaludis TaxID=39152 RepID=Q6LXA2_METMP|nr:DUF2109 domain-containing protein [Methanococcus maripaludis]MBA2839766.1 energy-converting hydrogenase A subunit C [Methanococcus maripaludis]MBA2847350.1 energy-converting hydrogenase A subunit C [Methanococcus maripaludis]MBA2857578.1 energy-converting hydrogenase A subunit C [Methanococcus maripaludis]MBA2868121.1 energy-converting hydrogenase A subunit C [Methanococcus maripaludis]MBB6067201.1 energy-converting hydrogenase A subunit C [Methanococcus maripaludis]